MECVVFFSVNAALSSSNGGGFFWKGIKLKTYRQICVSRQAKGAGSTPSLYFSFFPSFFSFFPFRFFFFFAYLFCCFSINICLNNCYLIECNKQQEKYRVSKERIVY